MQPSEYSCKWEEISAESDFNPDEGGQPVVFCRHPDGSGFCDYWEMNRDNPPQDCPLFKYAVPIKDVKKRQNHDYYEA